MVLGPPRKGIKLTYCTDTRPTKSIRENAEGSDLFICEGMYGEPEKAKKAVEYKHMDLLRGGETRQGGRGKGDVADALQPVADKTGRIHGRSTEDFSLRKGGKDRMSVDLDFPES